MAFDRLPARRAGIDTYQQPVVYLRSDCPVCRAEGFEAQTQVEVIAGHRHVLAILNHVTSDWLRSDEIALSEAAWSLLGVAEGEAVGGAPSAAAGFAGAPAHQGARRQAGVRGLARTDGRREPRPRVGHPPCFLRDVCAGVASTSTRPWR